MRSLMKSIGPTLAIALLAAPALASSIQPVASGGKGRGSVATISCSHCPPLKVEEERRSYVVPELEPGTQKVEIREIDGERRMFRSEAWFGGSPVVFVTKAPEQAEDAIAEAPLEAPAEPVAAVDTAAMTGALDSSAAAVAVTAAAASQPVASRELDPSTFELRLN